MSRRQIEQHALGHGSGIVQGIVQTIAQRHNLPDDELLQSERSFSRAHSSEYRRSEARSLGGQLAVMSTTAGAVSRWVKGNLGCRSPHPWPLVRGEAFARPLVLPVVFSLDRARRTCAARLPKETNQVREGAGKNRSANLSIALRCHQPGDRLWRDFASGWSGANRMIRMSQPLLFDSPFYLMAHSQPGFWAELRNLEDRVTGERGPTGRHHLNYAGSGARGYIGRDFGTGSDFEHCRRAVEGDAGRARQIRSQNLNLRFHLAGGRHRFYKRAETHVQAEDRAIAHGAAARVGRPALQHCPVQSPIGVLHQRPAAARARSVRAVEAVQRGQRAAGGKLEDRALSIVIDSAEPRDPVEIPIGSQIEVRGL